MKKLITVLMLCAVSVWADVPVGAWVKVKSETWTVANNRATNVALLTATSGVDVSNGGAVTTVISAESGQTITSGNMRCYVYMPVLEASAPTPTITYRWLSYPALDFAPTAGQRDAAAGDKQSLTGIGRITWVEDDMVVSGGTTVVSTLSRRTGQPMMDK